MEKSETRNEKSKPKSRVRQEITKNKLAKISDPSGLPNAKRKNYGKQNNERASNFACCHPNAGGKPALQFLSPVRHSS
jgi:hypothetical protein